MTHKRFEETKLSIVTKNNTDIFEDIDSSNLDFEKYVKEN
jgi:hypothetical protein